MNDVLHWQTDCITAKRRDWCYTVTHQVLKHEASLLQLLLVQGFGSGLHDCILFRCNLGCYLNPHPQMTAHGPGLLARLNLESPKIMVLPLSLTQAMSLCLKTHRSLKAAFSKRTPITQDYKLGWGQVVSLCKISNNDVLNKTREPSWGTCHCTTSSSLTSPEKNQIISETCAGIWAMKNLLTVSWLSQHSLVCIRNKCQRYHD